MNNNMNMMAAVANPRGIQLSKISPAFLHANSTSHTWAFSAFAELIDNAYDPDVSASELIIDKMEINGQICLIFLDNGAGIDTDHLLRMLSFGFCEKEKYEKTTSHLPIGHYGNGFKSGSMRLGKDALVFTRHQSTASIGFLSQSYLESIKADSVYIPIVTYRLPKLERIKSEQSRNNLNAILKYSVFKTEQDLKEELYALEGSKTGTKIILSSLKRLKDGRLELDFSSDEFDIRCPEAHEVDLTSVYHRPIQHSTSEYKHSLREYCSILFLRPRMKITIRGKRVKTKLISKSLCNTEIDSYKPTWLPRPLKISFGFTCQKSTSDDFGMMLYHRNRLIKAFEKVGYQKQPNDLGIGVVGVAQVDFLQPTHNKQDFNKDEKFNSVMAAFALKLNDYWNEKKQNAQVPLGIDNNRTAPDWLWAQCDQCLKWRRLPDGVNKSRLPDHWFCRLNPDPTHNRCEIPEEPEDEDLAVKSSYVKTFKKQKFDRKRQEFERQRREMEIHMTSQIQRREAQMMAVQTNNILVPLTVRPPQPPHGAITDLQKALAESQRREEENKCYIKRVQEERRKIEEEKKALRQLAESLQHTQGKKQTVLEEVNQFIDSIKPEQSSSPLGTPQKRKMDNQSGESPTQRKRFHHVKKEIAEAPPPPPPLIDSRKRNNPSGRNNGESSSSHSPLKVKMSGIINMAGRQDQQGRGALLSSTPSSSSGINSKNTPSSTDLKSRKKDNGVVVSIDDLDYEITVNDDYGESDEDVKPDAAELKLRQDRRQGVSRTDKDLKPNKETLDGKTDSSEGNKKRIMGADGDALLNPKIENTEISRTSTQDKVASSGSSPSGEMAHTGGDGQMPAEDTFSSNIDKVMAALESKFKKSSNSQQEEEGDEETGSADGGGDQTRLCGEESMDVVESGEGSVVVEGALRSDKSTVGQSSDNGGSAGGGVKGLGQGNKGKKEEIRVCEILGSDGEDDVVEIYSDDEFDFTNSDDVVVKKEVDVSAVKSEENNAGDAVTIEKPSDSNSKDFAGVVSEGGNATKSKLDNHHHPDEEDVIDMDEVEEIMECEEKGESVKPKPRREEGKAGEEVCEVKEETEKEEEAKEEEEAKKEDEALLNHTADAIDNEEEEDVRINDDNSCDERNNNSLPVPENTGGTELTGEREEEEGMASTTRNSPVSENRIDGETCLEKDLVLNEGNDYKMDGEDASSSSRDASKDNNKEEEKEEFTVPSRSVESVDSLTPDTAATEEISERRNTTMMARSAENSLSPSPSRHEEEEGNGVESGGLLERGQEENKSGLCPNENIQTMKEDEEEVEPLPQQQGDDDAVSQMKEVSDCPPVGNNEEIDKIIDHVSDTTNDEEKEMDISSKDQNGFTSAVVSPDNSNINSTSSGEKKNDELEEDGVVNVNKGEEESFSSASKSKRNVCHKECQTELVELSSTKEDGEEEEREVEKVTTVDEEIVENLRATLKVRSELLEKSEQRLENVLENVHHLLSFLSPGSDLGEVKDIEQTVKTMIQLHLEGSRSPSKSLTQSQDME